MTYATFGLGYLAIIGVPPFAGFFSRTRSSRPRSTAAAFGACCRGAALLGGHHRVLHDTGDAADVLRTERWDRDVHPHESPSVMTWPMIVLAVGSVGAGLLFAIGGTLGDWLEPVVGSHEAHHVVPAWVMTAAALRVVGIGVALAYRQYAERAIPEPRRRTFQR